jgi:hypothetical protein
MALPITIAGTSRSTSLRTTWAPSRKPLAQEATKSVRASAGTTVDSGSTCARIGAETRVVPKPTMPNTT